MNRRKMTLLSVVLSVLVLLLVAFIVRSNLRSHDRIVLPSVESSGEQSGTGGTGSEFVQRIEIRPDTVQSAIESLSRAEDYARSITIERFWTGGRSVSVTNAFASGGWLRLDSLETSAEVRHTILSPDGEVYLWYNSERTYFTAAAALSEDAEQGILTYEDVLELPTEQIVQADYRSYEGAECIYVETAADENGHSERYWVSTADGLLHAAERYDGDMLVYLMVVTQTGMEMQSDAFTLPDGTELHKAETVAMAKAVAEN